MKRPAFQFYPADWRKDVELRACSIAARGLWIDIMCLAHECDPYGHLVVNGKAMTPAQIAGQIGLTAAQCKALLAELIANGVARQTEAGVVYSKRMVDDEAARERMAEIGRKHGPKGAEHGVKGAEHGARGGRPRQETGTETRGNNPGSEPPQEPPDNPPSSSSSSSSSSAVIPSVGVPTAAAAAPPPAQTSLIGITTAEPKPLTARERVWALGVPLLGENARSLLGKLAKTYGEESLAAVLAETTAEPPVGDVKAWVLAACEQRSKSSPKAANGHHQAADIVGEDAEWAHQAGFANRWEAENEGCYRHNAASFRDGKRITQ